MRSKMFKSFWAILCKVKLLQLCWMICGTILLVSFRFFLNKRDVLGLYEALLGSLVMLFLFYGINLYDEIKIQRLEFHKEKDAQIEKFNKEKDNQSKNTTELIEQVTSRTLSQPLIINSIQHSFDADNPKIGKIVDGFTAQAIKEQIEDEGFYLREKPFPRYKENAKKFCNAAKGSLRTICTYSPLYYLGKLAAATYNPEHLPLFNGMYNKEDSGVKSDFVERIRVMCVNKRLKEEQEQFPKLFAVSFIWFLIFNTKFLLRWCTDDIKEDYIVFDEKYKLVYIVNPNNPETGTLSLKWHRSGPAGIFYR